MSNIDISTFWKEFKVNDNGDVITSLRGMSRVVGVNHTNFVRQFRGDRPDSKLVKLLKEYGFDPGALKENGIGEKPASLIVDYYANDAGRYRTKQAKTMSRILMTIGYKTWIQQQLNWQPPSRYAPFILSEPRKWTKMFGDNIYDEFARLTNLTWDKKTHRKPCMFASLTYEFVYYYLPEDVYNSIKNNQKIHGGYIHKIHEFLTPKGLECLKTHLQLVDTILMASCSLTEARRLIEQAKTKTYQPFLFGN